MWVYDGQWGLSSHEAQWLGVWQASADLSNSRQCESIVRFLGVCAAYHMKRLNDCVGVGTRLLKQTKIIQEMFQMSQRVRGTVKWFNGDKGYGFITQENGPDLFVHYSEIRGSGFRTLNEGDKVEFEITEGKKGKQASGVVVIQ
jgi:CspA family cold shock protein